MLNNWTLMHLREGRWKGAWFWFTVDITWYAGFVVMCILSTWLLWPLIWGLMSASTTYGQSNATVPLPASTPEIAAAIFIGVMGVIYVLKSIGILPPKASNGNGNGNHVRRECPLETAVQLWEARLVKAAESGIANSMEILEIRLSQSIVEGIGKSLVPVIESQTIILRDRTHLFELIMENQTKIMALEKDLQIAITGSHQQPPR